jgi:adenylosuccinate synthase
VGWFDSVVVRHARRVSGITGLSLNSIDVLTGLKTVKICTAYQVDGKTIEDYPADLEQLAKCKPVYEELPGWDEDITGVRNFQDLPLAAQHYIERITQLTGIPLAIFSVGPGRDQTIRIRPVYA